MRNFSLPPYSLGEIGSMTVRVGNLFGVDCEQTIYPELRGKGTFSMGSVSRDLVAIGAKFGIAIPPTNQMSQLGINLQTLISELSSRGLLPAGALD